MSKKNPALEAAYIEFVDLFKKEFDPEPEFRLEYDGPALNQGKLWIHKEGKPNIVDTVEYLVTGPENLTLAQRFQYRPVRAEIAFINGWVVEVSLELGGTITFELQAKEPGEGITYTIGISSARWFRVPLTKEIFDVQLFQRIEQLKAEQLERMEIHRNRVDAEFGF